MLIKFAFMRRRLLACCGGLALLSTPASGLDLGPLDGIPPPPEVSGASVAFGHRSFQGTADIGGGSTLRSRVDRQNVSLRYGRSARLGEMPAYFYASLPLVNVELGRELADPPVPGVELDPGEGVGDLALAGAIWPYVDRDRGRFVGVASYAVVPTGEYDVDRTFGLNLNPGNNRFAGILQAGFHQRLSDRLDWSIAADIMVFEDNDQFIGARFANPPLPDPAAPATLEVEPYASYQTVLTWRVHPALSLATSYYVDRGGEFRVDGGDWSRSINRERYGLWALVALSPRTRINLSYKSTVDDRSDLQLQDNAQVRFVRFF